MNIKAVLFLFIILICIFSHCEASKNKSSTRKKVEKVVKRIAKHAKPPSGSKVKDKIKKQVVKQVKKKIKKKLKKKAKKKFKPKFKPKFVSDHDLKCYTCTNCNAKQHARLEECSYFDDVCINMRVNNRVMKRCDRSDVCHSVEAFKYEHPLFYTLSFGTEDTHHGRISCCRHNYCNDAGTIKKSIFILPLSFLSIMYHFSFKFG